MGLQILTPPRPLLRLPTHTHTEKYQRLKIIYYSVVKGDGQVKMIVYPSLH